MREPRYLCMCGARYSDCCMIRHGIDGCTLSTSHRQATQHSHMLHRLHVLLYIISTLCSYIRLFHFASRVLSAMVDVISVQSVVCVLLYAVRGSQLTFTFCQWT